MSAIISLTPPPPEFFVCPDGHITAKLDGDGKCAFCGMIAAEYHVVTSHKPSIYSTEVARTAQLKHIPRLLAILDKKQLDYGPSNITRHGQLGLIVRMDDKLARLQNLLTNKTLPKHESIADSWDDLANYALIGAMLEHGDWPKS